MIATKARIMRKQMNRMVRLMSVAVSFPPSASACSWVRLSCSTWSSSVPVAVPSWAAWARSGGPEEAVACKKVRAFP